MYLTAIILYLIIGFVFNIFQEPEVEITTAPIKNKRRAETMINRIIASGLLWPIFAAIYMYAKVKKF